MNDVEFDDVLNVWVFDFHGDLIVLDAHDGKAPDERDAFLMEVGTDADNGMGD